MTKSYTLNELLNALWPEPVEDGVSRKKVVNAMDAARNMKIALKELADDPGMPGAVKMALRQMNEKIEMDVILRIQGNE